MRALFTWAESRGCHGVGGGAQCTLHTAFLSSVVSYYELFCSVVGLMATARNLATQFRSPGPGGQSCVDIFVRDIISTIAVQHLPNLTCHLSINRKTPAQSPHPTQTQGLLHKGKVKENTFTVSYPLPSKLSTLLFKSRLKTPNPGPASLTSPLRLNTNNHPLKSSRFTNVVCPGVTSLGRNSKKCRPFSSGPRPPSQTKLVGEFSCTIHIRIWM